MRFETVITIALLTVPLWYIGLKLLLDLDESEESEVKFNEKY